MRKVKSENSDGNAFDVSVTTTASVNSFAIVISPYEKAKDVWLKLKGGIL